MCLNCGCHVYNDDMGDPKNITVDMIKKLAELNNQTYAEALKEVHLASGKLLEKEGAGDHKH